MKLIVTICLMALAIGSVLMASTASKDIYLPAASHVNGAYQTVWRSDVRVYNPNTEDATVAITYMPMASHAADGITISVVVNRQETLSFEDILGGKFGILHDTAGALHFVSNVDIYVESRAYTPNMNGAPGTFGQRVPGIPATQAVVQGEMVDILYIDNLASDIGFRTNFGLVDAGGTGVNYTLAAYDQNGDNLGTYSGSLAANQWDQFNALDKLGVSGDVQYARLTFQVISGKSIPYASQADNSTGDAMYIDGTQIKSTTSGDCGSGRLWGAATQYLQGSPNWYWKDYINHPTIWTIVDNRLLSIQDPTPDLPASGDEAAAIYINPPGPGGTMVMLGYFEKFNNPILLIPGGTFQLSLQLDYSDSQSILLSANWTISGSFECPNHISGTINAVVTAIDPNYAFAAGSFDWSFEAGNN